MNYSECRAYLDGLGNEVLTMKFGLGSIRRLCGKLDDPHRKYPSILIAGTNGKGSVARFLANILQSAGLRTGLYTSPHIVAVEERIAINGQPITSDDFARHFSAVVDAVRSCNFEHHPTYFEILTALAFQYFAGAPVDIAVLEIGMGGRLDSTNIVDPALSVIMPIGLDHQQYLGDTLEEIAAEKAGIIHPRRPVLLAPQRPEALEVLRRHAIDQGSPVFEFDPTSVTLLDSDSGRYSFELGGTRYDLAMFGRHQVVNAAIAINAARQLPGLQISSEALYQGVRDTRVVGRIDRIETGPDVFLDGGHNRDAAEVLRNFLLEHTGTPRCLVLGMMRDKEVRAVAEILRPAFQRVYLTRVNSIRSASTAQLQSAWPEGIPVTGVRKGVEKAKAGSQTVVVGGSFYLVGELLSLTLPRDPHS